jgi:hypothetical protein
MEKAAAYPEVPNEEAVVKTIGALKDRYGDQHLAVECHQQPKKQTQGNVGSRKKLAAERRWMIRHAVPALLKEHGRQGPGKNDVVCGTPKGWTFKKR